MRGRSVLLGVVIAFLGFLILNNARALAFGNLPIGAAFRAINVAWLITGAGMLAGGARMLGSRGTSHLALWIAGAASAASGVILIAGVLTYVIPCSGPS
jgi:hypothetical protein